MGTKSKKSPGENKKPAKKSSRQPNTPDMNAHIEKKDGALKAGLKPAFEEEAQDGLIDLGGGAVMSQSEILDFSEGADS